MTLIAAGMETHMRGLMETCGKHPESDLHRIGGGYKLLKLND